MARAALNLLLRDLGAVMHLSAGAVDRMETYYRAQQVFCGPGERVSVGQDALAQEHVLVIALVQLLKESGIEPTSRELLDAYARAEKGEKPPEPKRRRRAREAWYVPNGEKSLY